MGVNVVGNWVGNCVGDADGDVDGAPVVGECVTLGSPAFIENIPANPVIKIIKANIAKQHDPTLTALLHGPL